MAIDSSVNQGMYGHVAGALFMFHMLLRKCTELSM
jgi:hypothetical protein